MSQPRLKPALATDLLLPRLITVDIGANHSKPGTKEAMAARPDKIVPASEHVNGFEELRVSSNSNDASKF